MQNIDFFRILTNEIHSVIAATVDENGLLVTCAMDIMDSVSIFLSQREKAFTVSIFLSQREKAFTVV